MMSLRLFLCACACVVVIVPWYLLTVWGTP